MPDFYSIRENYTIKPLIKIYPALTKEIGVASAWILTTTVLSSNAPRFTNSNTIFWKHDSPIDITDRLISIGDSYKAITNDDISVGLITNDKIDLKFNNNDKYFFKNGTTTELFYNRVIENSIIEIRYIKQYNEPTNVLTIETGYKNLPLEFTSNIEYLGLLKDETVNYKENEFNISAVDLLEILKQIPTNFNQVNETSGYNVTTQVGSITAISPVIRNNPLSFFNYNNIGIDVFNLFGNINYYLEFNKYSNSAINFKTEKTNMSICCYPFQNAIINLKNYRNYYETLNDLAKKTNSYIGLNKNNEFFIYKNGADWENYWSSASHPYNWEDLTSTSFIGGYPYALEWTSSGNALTKEILRSSALGTSSPYNRTLLTNRLYYYSIGTYYTNAKISLVSTTALASTNCKEIIINNFVVSKQITDNINMFNYDTSLTAFLLTGTGVHGTRNNLMQIAYDFSGNVGVYWNNSINEKNLITQKLNDISLDVNNGTSEIPLIANGGIGRFESWRFKFTESRIYIGLNGMSLTNINNIFSSSAFKGFCYGYETAHLGNLTYTSGQTHTGSYIINSVHVTTSTTDAEYKSQMKRFLPFVNKPTNCNNSYTIYDYAKTNIIDYDNYEIGSKSVNNFIVIDKKTTYEYVSLYLKNYTVTGNLYIWNSTKGIKTLYSDTPYNVMTGILTSDTDFETSSYNMSTGEFILRNKNKFEVYFNYSETINWESVYTTGVYVNKEYTDILYKNNGYTFYSSKPYYYINTASTFVYYSNTILVKNNSSLVLAGYKYDDITPKDENEANTIISEYAFSKEKLTVTVPFLYDNYDVLNYVTIKTDKINLPVNWNSKEFQIVGITNSYENQTTQLELKEL